MATFAELKTIRLIIDDPSGYVDFLEVSALPLTPVPWTAYKLTSTGAYWYHDGASWVLAPIRVSDERLGVWYDASGEEVTVKNAYQTIMRRLGSEMQIVKNSDGAESTDFIALLDLYNFYKHVLEDYQDDKSSAQTGRYSQTTGPQIAGGNL